MAAEIHPGDPRRPRRTPRPDFSRRRPSRLMVSLWGSKETEQKPTYLPESFPPDNINLAYLMSYLNYCDNVPLNFERIVSNIYEIHPDLLAAQYRLRGNDLKEWLFFTMRGRKYMDGTVFNLASGSGYWKLQKGSEEPIGGPLGANYGVCRTFCFYKGKQFESHEPSWYIEEYRLSEDYYERTKTGCRAFDDWVVCKLCQVDVDISPRVRNELNPVVNLTRKRFIIDPLTVNLNPILMADIYPLTVSLMPNHPVVCIPDLFKYFAEAPTPSTSLNGVQVQKPSGHPLIGPICPPMVYVILLCAMFNRGDQILKGSIPVIDDMIMTNIYELNPDELADDHGDSQDKEWFCFTLRSRDHANDSILNRGVGDGYWHLDMAYGRAIIATEDGASIGVRRTFDFYTGKYPGDKTSWTMHEFRLSESFLQTWKVADDWIVCKIWNKDKTPECKLLNSITERIGTTL